MQSRFFPADIAAQAMWSSMPPLYRTDAFGCFGPQRSKPSLAYEFTRAQWGPEDSCCLRRKRNGDRPGLLQTVAKGYALRFRAATGACVFGSPFSLAQNSPYEFTNVSICCLSRSLVSRSFCSCKIKSAHAPWPDLIQRESREGRECDGGRWRQRRAGPAT